MSHYVLDGHTPVVEPDLMRWARSFNSNRRVALTKIGAVEVSTVFLGINHNFGDGEPILFETMIFDETSANREWRYATWDEAQAGHDRIVAALTEGREP